MLKKNFCQKCYQKYEIPWTKGVEKAWDDKEIHCPPDAIFRNRAKLDSWIKKILAIVFGSLLSIKEDPPRWCEFKEKHK